MATWERAMLAWLTGERCERSRETLATARRLLRWRETAEGCSNCRKPAVAVCGREAWRVSRGSRNAENSRRGRLAPVHAGEFARRGGFQPQWRGDGGEPCFYALDLLALDGEDLSTVQFESAPEDVVERLSTSPGDDENSTGTSTGSCCPRNVYSELRRMKSVEMRPTEIPLQ